MIFSLAVDPNPADPAATLPCREVAFFSPDLDDLPTLLAALRPEVQAVMIDAGSDGLQQMVAWLADRSGLEAIHVVTHGSPGRLGLGTAWLGADTLAEHADALRGPAGRLPSSRSA
jgi:hypothetical protein